MASLALSRPHSYSCSPSHILGEKKKSRGDNIEVIVLSGPFHKINRSQSIRIRNSSDRSRILFKVKATAPQLLAVSPKAGILEPNEELDVVVTSQRFRFDQTARNRETLLIQSVFAHDLQEQSFTHEIFEDKKRFSQFWSTLRASDVMENLTRIRFVADEAAREKLIPTPKNLHSHRVYREPSEERPHRHKLRTTDSTHYKEPSSAARKAPFDASGSLSSRTSSPEMRPQGKKKPWFKKSSPTIETLSSSSEDEEVGLRDRKFIRKKRSPDMQALLDRVEPRSRPDVGVSSSVEQPGPFSTPPTKRDEVDRRRSHYAEKSREEDEKDSGRVASRSTNVPEHCEQSQSRGPPQLNALDDEALDRSLYRLLEAMEVKERMRRLLKDKKECTGRFEIRNSFYGTVATYGFCSVAALLVGGAIGRYVLKTQ